MHRGSTRVLQTSLLLLGSPNSPVGIPPAYRCFSRRVSRHGCRCLSLRVCGCLKRHVAFLQECSSKLEQLRTHTHSDLARQNACSHKRFEPEEGMLLVVLDVQGNWTTCLTHLYIDCPAPTFDDSRQWFFPTRRLPFGHLCDFSSSRKSLHTFRARPGHDADCHPGRLHRPDASCITLRGQLSGQ